MYLFEAGFIIENCQIEIVCYFDQNSPKFWLNSYGEL